MNNAAARKYFCVYYLFFLIAFFTEIAYKPDYYKSKLGKNYIQLKHLKAAHILIPPHPTYLS